MHLYRFFGAGLLLAMLPALSSAADDIKTHIQRLRRGDFEEREDATRKLIEAGQRSIDAVRAAAADDDLEVRGRAMRVLLSLAVSEGETSAQAEAALIELGKSKVTMVATLAKDSLRSVLVFRIQRRQEHIAALRKLGGVALLNEEGEVYRIDFEGQYISDEGLELQRAGKLRGKSPDLSDDEDSVSQAEFAAKYIVRTHVKNDDLAVLKLFPSLTYLNLQQTESSDGGLVYVESLRKLEHVTLNARTTDAGLAHLAELAQLKSLSIPQSQVTGAGLAQLKELSHLEELDLSNSRLDDAGLEALSQYPNLQNLKLGNTRITDRGTKYLSRLSKLNYLTLHGTAISDEGLHSIARLSELRSLQLDRTKVTDKGIQQLAALEHLQAVSFTEPLVSKAGVEELRAKLPKTNFHLWPAPPRR